ncbi:hypothetical protein [Micrococcus sp.]|uniref:hypothetical protein n=1 Tax=Micrococcus sp. TaxID=1271 RepID=UPI002A90F054|nr:hypothetical protein [Micrococcus sp.]MDY6054348.1 hypothetical protein [Micrococcus sp.]
MSAVTIQDVEARLGRVLTDSESGQVEAWIQDLDALVASRIPDLVTRGVSSKCDRGVLRFVYAQAIRRLLLNPEGLRQYTESIDDYSLTKTVDSSVSSSALYLTDDEWALLSPAIADGAFSIRAVGAPDAGEYRQWQTTTRWEVPPA